MANNKRKPNTKGKRNFQEKDQRDQDDRSYDRNKNYSSKGRKKNDHPGGAPVNYSNDPGWWNRAGNLTELSTNISTEIPIGIALETDMLQHWTPSGVLKLEYYPCFGDIDSPTHPFNVIARSLYDFINSRNSRSSQYDPSDLILYIIAVANAWSLHAWIRRIVGMYNTFSPMNRYWWDSVLATMGVAPISQTDDIDNWVSVANKIALTLNTLAVPRDIKYFDRTQMLTSAVYADSPTSKASLYYYQPAALFKYGYDEEGKGMLSLDPTPFVETNSSQISRSITPQVIWTYFEGLIENLLNDTDVSYMKADIRKAYDDKVYTIPQIDNKFSLGAVFDGYVNLQTRNATVHSYLKSAYFNSGYKVTQNMGTNSLTSTRVLDMINAHEAAKSVPSIAHAYGNGNRSLPHLFDFPVDNVTNDLVTEATKLHAFVANNGRFRATCEVIAMDCFYAFEYDWDTQTTSLVKTKDITTLGVENTGAPEISVDSFHHMMHGLELASKYAASPLQFVVYNDTESFYPIEGAYIIEDLTNYTTIDTEQLQDIWDAAQMSILAPFDLK